MTRQAWSLLAAMLAWALMSGWPQAAHAACLPDHGLPKDWPRTPRAGQVLIPAGEFTMGSGKGYADERPTFPVKVASFWIDRTEVSNAQFEAFVKAMAYVTDAERQGGGAVFVPPKGDEPPSRPMSWWRFVQGANWRQPTGPGSSIRSQADRPVLLVTQADALAYARWLGRDLPTEAEWEYAAKASRQDPKLDAAPRDSAGRPVANYWQGSFPLLDTAEDGHAGIAPVGCYAPNAWGLYDMIGNAWEWTKDAYRGERQPHANGDPSQALPPVRRVAVTNASRTSPNASPAKVVIKGGSFLCSPDYCVRYRASARESQEPDLATSHVGFRTVTRPSPSKLP